MVKKKLILIKKKQIDRYPFSNDNNEFAFTIYVVYDECE